MTRGCRGTKLASEGGVTRVIVFRFAGLAIGALVACSAAFPGAVSAPLPSVDIAEPDRGVPDHDDDPAVVLVESASTPACAGALLAPDVVLTAWHCIADFGLTSSGSPSCAGSPTALDPGAIHVLVGATAPAAVERAGARAVVAPGPTANPCDADVALLLLDQPIDDIAPLAVSATGAAQGEHVRTVGFDDAGAGAGLTRFLRDHVPVVATTASAFDVYEAACTSGCGGPALDETTGAVVGVASRWSPAAGGTTAADVYLRADAFLGLVQQALARSTAAPASAGDKSRQSALKGPADMGSACQAGADCAAAACATVGKQRYCTRRCSASDACPTHYRCEETTGGQTVCIED
jgi:hypothetical protein